MAVTECATNFTATSSQVLANPSLLTLWNDTQWTELQLIANHVELAKYSQTGGKSLGSNLLQKIYSTMNTYPSTQKQLLQQSKSSTGSDPIPSFCLYSAHYPTILGLLSSMGENNLQLEAIPNYASALIFELYGDNETQQDTIKILFKAGLQNVTVTLELKSVCAGQVYCPLVSIWIDHLMRCSRSCNTRIIVYRMQQ